MSDREIIEGLINRDNQITKQFLYVKCRPLLTAIMRFVYKHPVEYDDMVNQLYEYLMADNCAKLKKFEYRSSIYQWIKVVATRFFIRHRNSMIDNNSKDNPYLIGKDGEVIDPVNEINDKIDIENMLQFMDNTRYSDVIRNLVLNDVEPERYAKQIGVSVGNLYNIKKRAMASFTHVAIKYYSYGR